MGLNIIVCVKSVVLEAPSGRVVRSPESSELNPFDRPAIAMALSLREQFGGIITTLSMGPEASALALYETLALGVDRSVLVCDQALAGSDTLATSYTLGTAIKKLVPYDLILFGTRTSDSDTGQVGPQTATLLDLPLVSGIRSVEYDGSRLAVERIADEFIEKFEIILPGVLTIHPSAIQPGDAALTGIESAFEGDALERWNLSDLDLETEHIGESGSPTRIVSMTRVKKDRRCAFIDGSVEEQADELLRQLKNFGMVG